MAETVTKADLSHESDSGLKRNQIATVIAAGFLGWGITSADQGALSYALPGILAYFNITTLEFGVILDIALLVGWIAEMMSGPMLERYGRRRIFQTMFIVAAVGSLLSGLAINIVMLTVFRAVTLAGNAAEWPSAQTMTAESVPTKFRGFFISIVQSGYQFGYVLAGAFALILLPLAPISVSWRYLFIAIAIPAAIVAYLRYTVPETPRFKVMDAIRKAKIAGDQEEVSRLEKIYKVDKDKVVHFPIRQLFEKDLRRPTIVLTVYTFLKAWEFAFSAFIVLYLMDVKGLTSTLADSTVFFATMISIPGYLLAGFLGDKIGRREIALIYLGLAALLSIAFLLSPSGDYTIVVAIYGVFAIFAFGVWAANFGLYTENFPTRARGAGASLTSSMYWGGGVFWTALISVLISVYGFTQAYITVVLIGNFGAFAAMWGLKRYKAGQTLEEITY